MNDLNEIAKTWPGVREFVRQMSILQPYGTLYWYDRYPDTLIIGWTSANFADTPILSAVRVQKDHFVASDEKVMKILIGKIDSGLNRGVEEAWGMRASGSIIEDIRAARRALVQPLNADSGWRARAYWAERAAKE